jgi:polysaccharide biosynthesis protein PelF
MRRPLVCLVLEGTYPYVSGGVSSWTHQLITSLPEVDFFLYTLSPVADQEPVYDIPDNVVGSRDILLMPSGFELVEAGGSGRRREDRTAMSRRIARLRTLFPDRRDAAIEGILSELESAAALRTYSTARWRGNFEGIIPGYRGGPWMAALERLWSDVIGQHLSRNPFYGMGEYFWTWYNSRITLLRLLEERPPEADVYHALCTGYAGFLTAIAKGESGRPFLLTEHGIYHRERLIEIQSTGELRGHQRDQWGEMFLALSRFAYRSADRIITLFEANQQLELRMGAPAARCEVIPNGIDLPRFFGVKRAPRPGRHVGLVGRVVPIKDIKTFLVAARIVAETVDDVTFWIVGPTEESPTYYEECLQMTAAFGLEDRVVYTGSVDVREYYAFLDVLVLTSLSEAQPLVILEAVAAGIPCVATRVGDVPALLSHDERLIAPPKDAEGIARRIAAICRNPEEYSAWVEERQEAVRTVYDRVKIFQQYGEIYRRYAAAGSPAGSPAEDDRRPPPPESAPAAVPVEGR